MKDLIDNRLQQDIFKLLYQHQSLSIADISKLLKKSVPNITKIINELMEAQCIEEQGYAPSTGGRRAVQYTIHGKLNQAVIAVAVDQYYTTAGILSLKNKELIPLQTIENKLDQAHSSFDNIKLIIQNLLKSPIFKTKKCLGIGISMPGFVDSKLGINGSYPEGSKLHQIKNLLEAEFSVPIFLENDSAVIAIAEHKLGAAKGSQNALIINMNWGVGLGMIINNQLFRGHSGYAGEFSHIPLSNTQKLCSCGKRGCMEVEASLIAALEYANEQLEKGEHSSLQHLSELQEFSHGDFLLKAALSGDQLAIKALNKSAYMIGKGVATLIHILNPEKIILSGRGAIAGSIIVPTVQSAVNEFAIPQIAHYTNIELSKLNIHAQLLGTTYLVVEKSNFPKV
ncbi:ROK family transcriptional regulator [Rhinopithecimicrobium faecis]|uniref:ROK family transcriptional regulator n=1 Tax=Rhinopithecimicrobium faecis TaxID=2820698 RepID=UPI00336593E5